VGREGRRVLRWFEGIGIDLCRDWSRVGGRHVRCYRAVAALGALIAVNSCVRLVYPRYLRVMNP
jgi:hypothetical protein